jgi:general secretion pathway protein L
VQGAVAQFPEQQQISDTLKRAYAPVVRRLRQVVQATVSSSRLRVVKIVLTGGGSKVLNLDRHLAEELNVRVVRARELSQTLRGKLPADPVGTVSDDTAGSESAIALGLALAGLAGQRNGQRFDFRVGPFAWRGDFDFLRERAVPLSAWAAAIMLTVGAGAIVQLYSLSGEDTRLYQQQLALCEQITGQRVESTSVCDSMIREKISGTSGFQIPDHSALDTFMEISRRLPYSNELKRKVTELDITSERVRIKGTTESYEAIDTMVDRLQGGKCFTLVEKGKARNINAESVEFNVTMTLDCAAAPGDGKTFPAPPGPSASAFQTPPPASATPAAAQAQAAARAAADARRDESRAAEQAAAAKTKAVERKNSPEELEARRDRLRKLREERASRRKQMLENPVARPGIRDRFERMPLPIGGDDAGDE